MNFYSLEKGTRRVRKGREVEYTLEQRAVMMVEVVEVCVLSVVVFESCKRVGCRLVSHEREREQRKNPISRRRQGE